LVRISGPASSWAVISLPQYADHLDPMDAERQSAAASMPWRSPLASIEWRRARAATARRSLASTKSPSAVAPPHGHHRAAWPVKTSSDRQA
jgi:hypothetical protein